MSQYFIIIKQNVNKFQKKKHKKGKNKDVSIFNCKSIKECNKDNNDTRMISVGM